MMLNDCSLIGWAKVCQILFIGNQISCKCHNKGRRQQCEKRTSLYSTSLQWQIQLLDHQFVTFTCCQMNFLNLLFKSINLKFSSDEIKLCYSQIVLILPQLNIESCCLLDILKLRICDSNSISCFPILISSYIKQRLSAAIAQKLLV